MLFWHSFLEGRRFTSTLSELFDECQTTSKTVWGHLAKFYGSFVLKRRFLTGRPTWTRFYSRKTNGKQVHGP